MEQLNTKTEEERRRSLPAQLGIAIYIVWRGGGVDPYDAAVSRLLISQRGSVIRDHL